MPESATTLGLYSASLIPSLIPRQHENETGLIPRPSSLEVGIRQDEFSNLVHRIQALPFSSYTVTIPHTPRPKSANSDCNLEITCSLLQLWNFLRSTTEHTMGESTVLSMEYLVVTFCSILRCVFLLKINACTFCHADHIS